MARRAPEEGGSVSPRGCLFLTQQVTSVWGGAFLTRAGWAAAASGKMGLMTTITDLAGVTVKGSLTGRVRVCVCAPPREGEFTVTVLAFNAVSAASLGKHFFVVRRPCQPPPVRSAGPGRVQVRPAFPVLLLSWTKNQHLSVAMCS